jgi:hypothetical protein
VGIGAKQCVPPARGGDIPSVRNNSFVNVIMSSDENGDFVIPLWSGEFTLFAGGTQWSDNVTKTINVEQGKPLHVDMTLPTPLRVSVVMPDGSPAGNFRLCHMTVYHSILRNKSANRPPEVAFNMLYESRDHMTQIWANDKDGPYEWGPQFVAQERPLVMYLSPDANYVTVMTEDNEYGLVRKLEPELMGKELTLTLRPTIAGTAKLIEQSRKPVAEKDIAIQLRFLKFERNGNYVERSGYLAQKLWFSTDAEGRLNFKVPVLEGVDDTVSLFFSRQDHGGRDVWDTESLMSFTNEFGRSWFGIRYNGKWYSKAGEWYKQFRPPADGAAFDLGVWEVEW